MWLSKDYLAKGFIGCTCIASVDSVYFGGMIEIYELHGRDKRKAVGAWYPDMAMQTWPIKWFWDLEETGQVFAPPATPRNRTHRWRKGRAELTRIPMKGLQPPDDGIKRQPLSGKRKRLGKKLARR